MARWIVFLILFFLPQVWASVDIGIGSSSFTAGRPIPALALGFDGDSWGAIYRSVGVRTTVYAQNAWMLAGHPYKFKENLGMFEGSISAGLGAASMVRAYRDSPSAATASKNEFVFGPQFALKVRYGYFYFGFDTLLGLNSQIVQHVVLNFQDLAHVTFGISL